MSLPAVRAAGRLSGLPLCDPAELDDATGFVRLVRRLVTVPLTTLGLLAAGAALSMGNIIAAGIATAITAGVVVSIVRDTRLSKALDQLRTGAVEQAEASMVSLTAPEVSPDRQRMRAEAYLAAIAWSRGDTAAALSWTQARRSTLLRLRAPADEHFLTEVTEVLLLALRGEVDAAERALAAVEPCPPGARYLRGEALARLSVAFARDEPERVAEALQRWLPLTEPSAPLLGALMVWALDRNARTAEAYRLRSDVDTELIRPHAPRLHDWLRRFDDARLRYRTG
ncbi:MAG: hypothetical protein AAGA54_03445 [Myxococcota bacterium]